MKQLMRDSGLPCLGETPWGSHLCHLYNNADEILEVMVPYFSAGLKNNELCIWICSEPIEVSEARRALSDCVADFDAFLASDRADLLIP